MSLKSFAQIFIAILIIATVWIGWGPPPAPSKLVKNIFNFDKVEVREALHVRFSKASMSRTASRRRCRAR